MSKKRTDKVEPSFLKLIKWAVLAVIGSYLASISNDLPVNIIFIIGSIICAINAISEAVLIQAGQKLIDDVVNKMDNENNKE